MKLSDSSQYYRNLAPEQTGWRRGVEGPFQVNPSGFWGIIGMGLFFLMIAAGIVGAMCL